jgi:hypothetical protein
MRDFDRRQHANDAIEPATSGDGVGMRTDEQWWPLTTGRGARSAADEIACSVNLNRKARRRHLLGEPGSGLPITGCERTACPARLIWVAKPAQPVPIFEQAIGVDCRQSMCEAHATGTGADTGLMNSP